jgi:hypothetical protein
LVFGSFMNREIDANPVGLVIEMMSNNKRVRTTYTAVKQDRLACAETGWNLNGGLTTELAKTRTRHGGNGRPNLNKRTVFELSSDSEVVEVVHEIEETAAEALLEENEDDEDEGEEEEEDEQPNGEEDEQEEQEGGANNEPRKKKPAANQIIIETSALEDIIENTCHCCSECLGPVDVSYRTICLATSVHLTRRDELWGFVYHAPCPAAASLGEAKSRECSTDYALNIQYVLGFIASGDGGVEASRLLGLMGLPNDTTMETRSFLNIKDRISSFIQELSKDIPLENLVEEVSDTVV